MVGMMVTGPEGRICDECVMQAVQIVELQKEREAYKEPKPMELLTPKEIYDFLDQYVVGQEMAKKVLSIAVYNHYKRINQALQKDDDVVIDKSNILLVGDTGSGKTYLVRTLAKILQVPFCIVDATVFTEAGYVGEDVESIISRLLQAAHYDVALAERGIVYIDEIDKIARKGDNPSITRDVSGEGVQQSLLKLLEGSVVHAPSNVGRKHPDQKMISVNTDKILFICGGAFDGIRKIIHRRVNHRPIGFSVTSPKDSAAVDDEHLLRYVSSEDIKRFGLIPELVGRLPVVCGLETLTESQMRSILVEPKNSLIKQYVKLFEMDGIALSFTDDALDFISQQALALNIGARGLRTVCENIMHEVMYLYPSIKDERTSLVIDRAYASKQLFDKQGTLTSHPADAQPSLLQQA